MSTETTLPVATPRADVVERSDRIEIMLDLPGADRDSIEAQVERGVLVVRARAACALPADAHELRREFAARRFERSFHLAVEIDSDAIRARYDDGVLQLELPRRQPARRSIPIRTEPERTASE